MQAWGNFETLNGRDAPPKCQSGSDRPVGAARRPYHRKTAEACRRSVIRMTFQVRAQLENPQSVEWIATELVERIQNAETNGCTAAKAPRLRNFFYD